MSTYTTEAREVIVGDILIDEDHVAWRVEDIDRTESFGPYRSTFGLQFLLARVEKPYGDEDAERNESYDFNEEVTLDAQDEEGMPFDDALWLATKPNPDYQPPTHTHTWGLLPQKGWHCTTCGQQIAGGSMSD